MSGIPRLTIDPPLLNSSCPWASSREDLQALYESAFTGAVTTRTATLNGFEEDERLHTVAFSEDKTTSINSYGYSPHPLSAYISWVRDVITSGPVPPRKPFIVSITSSSPQELSEMLDMVMDLRKSLASQSGFQLPNGGNLIAVELNTSCPNIPDKPPPAYTPREGLKPLLEVMANTAREDPTATFGLKLAPFVYRKQQQDLVDVISEFTTFGRNPFSFFTCTNTLGSCVMVQDNAPNGESVALPTKYGGLAGEPLHYLALGNVMAFSELLASHPDPAMKEIGIIGVGGVTSPQAFQRMRKAGASAVACATALGLEGVGVFDRLLPK
ncbi:related to dihydroorotate dehydrogenase a [Serendipita indica DSM 11827]|uniref:Dihydroorotate oxidase n=1 Tax=Serendipita indica (strain DSM 11827) TaxID=1109443 RepID=G4TBB0_SERID|nr:related to dihydroorotate dehydrogenase a [Serendipita indica DSM 11827]